MCALDVFENGKFAKKQKQDKNAFFHKFGAAMQQMQNAKTKMILDQPAILNVIDLIVLPNRFFKFSNPKLNLHAT